MIEDFDVTMEERRNATIEVPLSEDEQKRKPTRTVHVYKTLRQLLGYDPIDMTDPDIAESDYATSGPQSAYEAGLLDRMERGELTEEERARFGE